MDEKATAPFRCARCGRDAEAVSPLGRAPFPGPLGERVAAEVCGPCFEDWKRRQMLLINHYGLDLQDDRARQFLYRNLRSFLFEEGEADEIDTSREGSVEW